MRPRRIGLLAATIVTSFLLGVALAELGARFGVAAMFAVPLGAALLVATISRPTLGVALVLAAIPVGLKTLPVGFVVVQGVAMAAIATTVLVRLARSRMPLPLPIPALWGVAVLVLCLLATPRALNSTLAVKQDIDVLLGILLVLTTVAATQSLDALRRLAHVLIVVGALIALLSLGHASALHAVAGAQRVDNRLQGTFTEPNQFGAFSAIAVMVGIGLMLSARDRAERWWCGILTTVTAVAMLLALSRGAWIGFMLGAVLLLVLVPQARRALGVTVLVVLVTVPLFGLLSPDLPQVTVVRERVSTLHLPANTLYDSRPAIWAEAAREISASPLLGEGPGQFPVVSKQNESSAATVFADHAHNVLLTVAAEAGIPAALCLIGFTITMTVVLRRTVHDLRGSRDGPLVAGLGAALAVVVGQGLVDFTLRNADIFLLLSVLVGLVLAASRLSRST
jgi:O-antigen ligase